MKKFVTIFALLLFIVTNALYAQPQTERIRKEIKQKGATAHLLTEMARIFSTSQPDSAIHYAKLAQAKSPKGTDLITLYAALGEANMAQGKTKEALQLFTRAQKLPYNKKIKTSNTTNCAAWVFATAVCNNLTKPLNATNKSLTTDLNTTDSLPFQAIKTMLPYVAE